MIPAVLTGIPRKQGQAGRSGHEHIKRHRPEPVQGLMTEVIR